MYMPASVRMCEIMQCFKAHRIKSILNEFVCCFISDTYIYPWNTYSHTRKHISNERMLQFRCLCVCMYAVSHLSYGFLSSILLLLFYQRGKTKYDLFDEWKRRWWW